MSTNNSASRPLDSLVVNDIESEYGTVSGIDLGSILSPASSPDNEQDYRADLASRIEADPAWEVHCHAMVSGGAWARRYYIGRRVA